jgi:hypothetical protein
MPSITEDIPELVEHKSTVADAYNYWTTLAYYGYDYDGTEYNREEAIANSIGWASRNQNEIL